MPWISKFSLKLLSDALRWCEMMHKSVNAAGPWTKEKGGGYNPSSPISLSKFFYTKPDKKITFLRSYSSYFWIFFSVFIGQECCVHTWLYRRFTSASMRDTRVYMNPDVEKDLTLCCPWNFDHFTTNTELFTRLWYYLLFRLTHDHSQRR